MRSSRRAVTATTTAAPASSYDHSLDDDDINDEAPIATTSSLTNQRYQSGRSARGSNNVAVNGIGNVVSVSGSGLPRRSPLTTAAQTATPSSAIGSTKSTSGANGHATSDQPSLSRTGSSGRPSSAPAKKVMTHTHVAISYHYLPDPLRTIIPSFVCL
jgi:hypothetical protein